MKKILLFLIISYVVGLPLVKAQTTKLFVDPSSVVDLDLGLGETFTVYMNISDVENLYGYAINLSYNTTLLDLTATSTPPSLWSNIFVLFDTVDETNGIYNLVLVALSPSPTFNGNTSLATLVFTVNDYGLSDLDIYQSDLSGYGEVGYPIPHVVKDGYFRNIAIITCYSDLDCDDADDCTTNICVNPGTYDSYCSFPNAPDGTSCSGNPGRCCSGICDDDGTTGGDYHVNCRYGPSCLGAGDWGSTIANEGGDCGPQYGHECYSTETCSGHYYRDTCVSGYCSGIPHEIIDSSQCDYQDCGICCYCYLGTKTYNSNQNEDCDPFDIATCFNNPDNNPLTWDYLDSQCLDIDQCSQPPITHTCDKSTCGAECTSETATEDCPSGVCRSDCTCKPLSAFEVTIISPEAKNYSVETVWLNVSAEIPVDFWEYENNSGIRTGFTPNETITVDQCFNELTVYANSGGEEGYSSVQFVALTGDVDRDLDTDIFDIVWCAGAYGTSRGGIDFKPECDIATPPDGDGEVDIFDIVLMGGNYGAEC